MAMMAVSSGMALKSSVCVGKSDFMGKTALRQSAAPSSSKTNVSFTIKAAGYDDELVKTAVSVACGACPVMEVSDGSRNRKKQSSHRVVD